MTENDQPSSEDTDEDSTADDPPESVVDEAERLTRLAREAVDDAEAAAYRERRGQILAAYDFRAREREDDDGAVLALYPAEWLDDGTVDMDSVEDVERGIERSLSGPGDAAEWEAVESHNRELADTVAAADDVHGANAHALADFAGNHYAKRIERLTADELAEFRTEYFPRNAWPSDERRATLAESIRRVYAAAEASVPEGALED